MVCDEANIYPAAMGLRARHRNPICRDILSDDGDFAAKTNQTKALYRPAAF